MAIKNLEIRASKLAEKYSDKKIMVDVHQVAHHLNLTIKEVEFSNDISGVLYIDKGKGVIGYNKNESPLRQRFSIAHEIGHFLLHRLENEIFVDKNFKALYRNSESATGEIKMEREANAFAAALLMPKERVIREFEKLNFDLSDEEGDVVERLAKKFKVSKQAMTFRISNLELFSY